MPVIESYADGTPSWVDLSTSDPEGAKAFYGAMFGWEFDDQPAGDQGVYTMASKNGHSAAGMMQQSAEQAAMGIPCLWNTYVTCRDLDGALAKVGAAGGNVMMAPMDVMDVGRMAAIVDPTGAVVALWEPMSHIGCEIVNESGALIWNELTTPEGAAAAAFYAEVFEWESEIQDMPNGPYTVFKLGEQPIGGSMAPPEDGIPSHWSVVFAVDDCAASLEAAAANGGTVLNGPMDIGIGILGVVMDPQGATFQIMQPVDA